MKRSYYIFVVGLIVNLCFISNTKAQLLRKLKQKTEDKIVETLDKELNASKDENKEDNKSKDESNTATNTSNSQEEDVSIDQEKINTEAKLWTKYDFVPGNIIIFWDNLMDEQAGDFPSKWDLLRGNAEVAKIDDENVILFKNGFNDRTGIFPLLEDKSVFSKPVTIEFDIFLGNGFWEGSEDFSIKLWEQPGFLQGYHEHDDDRIYAIDFSHSNNELNVAYGDFGGNISGNRIIEKIGWHHIALSYDGRGLKLFFNEDKLLNIPIIKVKPTDFNIIGRIETGNYQALKNIKVAAGNIKLQKRILTEGKYVANGILFETNKADIKPHSYGIIKRIAQLMHENPSWKFVIEGHTDNIGEESHNLELSEKRASSVVEALIAYEVNAERLQSEGKGENFPLADNGNQEGRANNRRVEFILMK